MNPSEVPNEKKNASSGATPPDASKGKLKDEPKVTHVKIVESKKFTKANWVTKGLLIVSIILAGVNGFTYWNIADNYKIINRPYVKLTPIRIINMEQKGKKTKFQLDLKVENFGQIPAFVEATDILVENILDSPKGLPIWDSKKPYAIKRFALFQNDEGTFHRDIILGDYDVKRIQKTETVYVVFSIKYNRLDVPKDLQGKPFHYWAKYRCEKFLPDKGEPNKSFLIEECGVTEYKPTSDLPQKKPLPKSTQTTTTSIISPAWPISP